MFFNRIATLSKICPIMILKYVCIYVHMPFFVPVTSWQFLLYSFYWLHSFDFYICICFLFTSLLDIYVLYLCLYLASHRTKPSYKGRPLPKSTCSYLWGCQSLYFHAPSPSFCAIFGIYITSNPHNSLLLYYSRSFHLQMM